MISGKTGDISEISAFLRRGRMEVSKYFIRDFCLWELIHEIGVINSGVKSGVQ